MISANRETQFPAGHDHPRISPPSPDGVDFHGRSPGLIHLTAMVAKNQGLYIYTLWLFNIAMENPS
jgi:hypothetical protein